MKFLGHEAGDTSKKYFESVLYFKSLHRRFVLSFAAQMIKILFASEEGVCQSLRAKEFEEMGGQQNKLVTYRILFYCRGGCKELTRSVKKS